MENIKMTTQVNKVDSQAPIQSTSDDTESHINYHQQELLFNLWETSEGLQLWFVLPQYNHDHLDLNLEDRKLNLSVKYGTTHYFRSVALSTRVDIDQISANEDTGLLKVHLPWKIKEKRQVEITSL